MFKKKGHKHCPKIGKCMNCMPTGDDVDDFKCWPVKQAVTYKVRQRSCNRTGGACHMPLNPCVQRPSP